MTLTTLADVRALLGHLPAETLDKTTWRHVFRCLDEAAHSVDIDKAVEVYALLQMVLMMEGVEYSNPKRPDAASRRHGRSMN